MLTDPTPTDFGAATVKLPWLVMGALSSQSHDPLADTWYTEAHAKVWERSRSSVSGCPFKA